MNGHTNGHTNGTELVNGASSSYKDQQAVNEIRKFVIDICRQNGGGHGGSGNLISTLMMRYTFIKELRAWEHLGGFTPPSLSFLLKNQRFQTNSM